MQDKILVTRSFMPSLDEYVEEIREIWDSHWLTNMGPKHKQFQKALTDYLWPIIREMAKTAIENKQNLIVEGCYIPFDWTKDFEPEYLAEIKYCCLIMSENYIRNHFDDIKKYANMVENRLCDDDCTMETVLRDNAEMLKQCQRYHANYILIDKEYAVMLEL